MISQISELQVENESLKARIKELEEMCHMCSTKMHANIGALQEDLLGSSMINNGVDDVIMLAIAGLKQVIDWIGSDLTTVIYFHFYIK